MAQSVLIRSPNLRDQAAFLDAVKRSRQLHYPWVSPPATPAAVRRYLTRQNTTHRIFLVLLKSTRELAGVVNISEIVRGNFQSAYLGYYAFEPYARKGWMREGMAQVIAQAFGTLRLHRLEANIQPANTASRALVRSLGFQREGYSPRYLKINGRWRDHERWALLAENWLAENWKSRGIAHRR